MSALAGDAVSVTISAFGGFILLFSGLLFLTILLRGMRAPAADENDGSDQDHRDSASCRRSPSIFPTRI
jgi:hypothetical protein